MYQYWELKWCSPVYAYQPLRWSLSIVISDVEKDFKVSELDWITSYCSLVCSKNKQELSREEIIFVDVADEIKNLVAGRAKSSGEAKPNNNENNLQFLLRFVRCVKEHLDELLAMGFLSPISYSETNKSIGYAIGAATDMAEESMPSKDMVRDILSNLRGILTPLEKEASANVFAYYSAEKMNNMVKEADQYLAYGSEKQQYTKNSHVPSVYTILRPVLSNNTKKIRKEGILPLPELLKYINKIEKTFGPVKKILDETKQNEREGISRNIVYDLIRLQENCTLFSTALFGKK